MASLKDQAQLRALVGKVKRLEKENAELKALVQTLTTWNEAFKKKLLESRPELPSSYDL